MLGVTSRRLRRCCAKRSGIIHCFDVSNALSTKSSSIYGRSVGTFMFDSKGPQNGTDTRGFSRLTPHLVVGITHPQTCLVLKGRLRALREAGFRVTLVSSAGAMLDRMAASEGIETIAIPMERQIAPWADLVSLVRLWRLLLRLKPDVVEFSTPKAGLLGMLAGLLAGVPLRVYLLRGLKLETTTGIKRRVLLMAERMAAACAQVVLCNSASLRAKALALGIAPAVKLCMLGEGSSIGVDVERFSPGPSDIRERLGLPRYAPVVGFVGRLTRDKGIPDLIEAFERILEKQPRAYLLLVGWFDASEDALDGRMCARIEKHPRIVRTGIVADVAPYYRAMDVLILPTLREGFPNVVLEASATGIPVITTLSTGARDAVLPELTGLLIPAGYPEAIVEAATRLLRSPAERQRMGAAGRAWVIEHFVDRHIQHLTTTFYGDMLKSEAVSASGEKPAMDLAAPLRSRAGPW